MSSWRTTSSLVGKYRKNVLGDTSAAAAICSTVVRWYPFARNSRSACSLMAARVLAFFRSRKPSGRSWLAPAISVIPSILPVPGAFISRDVAAGAEAAPIRPKRSSERQAGLEQGQGFVEALEHVVLEDEVFLGREVAEERAG